MICLWSPGAQASAPPEVRPFGSIACAPQEGVRFCPGSVATRIKTFDGVPLDVNVTLPANRSRHLPLIIQLHGYGGRKSGLSDSREWASKGYAVLNYTARGFGDSCGSAASRTADPQGCAKGWVHLADSRFEVRDSQYLAGLLADQGIVHPRKIGVMGGSYGGGQSLQLAVLRDRTRLADGSYVRWKSPRKRLRMTVAAAAPTIPWSDLAYSLVPNGGTLDFRVTGRTDDLFPLGIQKQSYVTGLYAAGIAVGYYSAAGQDPSADLRTWNAITAKGEPYGADAEAAVREMANNHSAYYLDHSVVPAPTLISNGFTDDLFPVDEAVRWVNRVKAKHPKAKVAQLHFDYGHARGQNKAADQARLRARTHDWFDRHVKGERERTLTGVEAMTQTCPKETPSGGPYWRGPGTPSAPVRCAIATTRPRWCSQPRAVRPSELGWTRSSEAAPAWRYLRPTRPARRPTACRPHGQGLHVARLAHRHRTPRDHGAVAGAGGAALGRGARRCHADAGRARAVASGRQRANGVPAPRQRMAFCPRARGQARAARQGRPLRPPVELPVVDQRFQVAPTPAGGERPGKGAVKQPKRPPRA